MGAIPTVAAAALCGMTPAAFRKAMHRRGYDFRLPGPDSRTPLWDESRLAEWIASRRPTP